jgi:DNA polymerase-3 subunit gamma/tau
MAYQIFARKWRPQNFDEIVGQEELVTRLKNAILQNRLPHAFLFAGSHGVGKTSTARILAKSLNCKDGPTVNPCNNCPACKEINEGRSMDVLEIDGASNRGIDEIRSLRENIKFSPTLGKFKIYIIDEVHQITSDGFNALLKTLEEPPDFVKFIFATTHAHKIIPTILSRCQRFNFHKISTLKIIEQLKNISKAEGAKIEPEVFLAIAKEADGSMRDAESMLDQLITFTKDKVSLKDIVSVLGIIEQEVLFDITDKLIDKEPLAVLKLLDEVIRQGKDTGSFINDLLDHFRNLMVVKLTKGENSALIDLPEDVCKKLLSQSKRLTIKDIFNVFNTLIGALEASRKLFTFKLPLEIALVKLSQGDGKIENESVIKKDSEEPIKTSIKVVRVADKKEDKPVEPASVSKEEPVKPRNLIEIDGVKELWPNILEKVSQVKIYIKHCLENAVLLEVKNNILTLGFGKQFNFYKEALEAKDNRLLVEKIISELSGESVRINFELVQQSVFDVASPLESIEQDEAVSSALKLFKGRVVDA